MTKLNGTWKLCFTHNGEEKEIPCAVPGNIELALAEVGLVPKDLFFGKNISALAPFEAYDFTYERTFCLTDEELKKTYKLRFEGVDCIAEYFLNGKKIGESADALVEHEFDAVGLQSENTLRILLKSPIKYAISKEYTPIYGTYQKAEPKFIRKAPHCFGWDIMPRAILGGIWRSVTLVEVKKYGFRDLYLTTREADKNGAELLLNYTFTASAEELFEMEVEMEGRCGDSSFCKRQRPLFVSERMAVHVDNPKLWWPRGSGEANLYNITVRLLKNGVCVSEKHFRHGIRVVEVIRTPYTDKNGSGDFRFRINHTDIFCRGTNLTPLDAFHSRDAARYKKVMALLCELDCNMVRCWGGNVYEDNEFFDLCDENGIMVWQDFAMACTNYPQNDEEFKKQLSDEVKKVVIKLRSHTSLVLWCGDNECDHLYLEPESNTITRSLIPELLRIYDPFRAYVPSSPYRNVKTEEAPEKYKLPDNHLWGDGSYYKSTYYSESPAHFVSEIGYVGCPPLDSMKKFISKDKLWPYADNDEWLAHAVLDRGGRNGHRIKVMVNEIRLVLGYVPDTLNEFICASQVIQAEAYKFFIENSRIKKWTKTGVLWWQLIDGWPQINLGVVDYYFRKKLAYYYIKDAQQPLCLIAGEICGWRAPLYMCNDTRETCSGTYTVTDCESGEVLLQGEYTAEDNTVTLLADMAIYQSDQRLLRLSWTQDDKVFTNYKLFHNLPLKLSEYISLMEKEEKYAELFGALQHPETDNVSDRTQVL